MARVPGRYRCLRCPGIGANAAPPAPPAPPAPLPPAGLAGLAAARAAPPVFASVCFVRAIVSSLVLLVERLKNPTQESQCRLTSGLGAKTQERQDQLRLDDCTIRSISIEPRIPEHQESRSHTSTSSACGPAGVKFLEKKFVVNSNGRKKSRARGCRPHCHCAHSCRTRVVGPRCCSSFGFTFPVRKKSPASKGRKHETALFSFYFQGGRLFLLLEFTFS